MTPVMKFKPWCGKCSDYHSVTVAGCPPRPPVTWCGACHRHHGPDACTSDRRVPRYDDQSGAVTQHITPRQDRAAMGINLADELAAVERAGVGEEPAMRAFSTGATRSSDAGKLDYEGFLHPSVLEAYAAYMDVNRTQADGKRRDSDNWQNGMPAEVWMKSGLRHILDMWKATRGVDIAEGELGAAAGTLFNVMGWIFDRIKADPEWLPRELAKYKAYRAAELAARK